MILDKKGTVMFRLATVIPTAALLVFLAAPASLEAQRRGGVGIGSGAVRTSPARPSTSIGRPVTPFVNPPVTGFGRAPTFGTSRGFPRSRGVGGFPGFIPTYGYGYGYYPYNYYSPYPGAVSVAPDPITQQGYGYDSGYGYAQDQYAQQAEASAAQNQADLTYEVSRLSQEVEDLRQQQAMMQPAPPPQPVTPTPVTPTVLVFRDGHQTEIQNYAVVGQTLWILDDRATKRVPLSDLDLDATQRENRTRGMRFSVPSR